MLKAGGCHSISEKVTEVHVCREPTYHGNVALLVRCARADWFTNVVEKIPKKVLH